MYYSYKPIIYSMDSLILRLRCLAIDLAFKSDRAKGLIFDQYIISSIYTHLEICITDAVACLYYPNQEVCQL